MTGFAIDLCGWGLLLCLALAGLQRSRRWPGACGKCRWPGNMLLVLVLLAAPFPPARPIEMMRGLFAGLSVTTVVMLVALLLACNGSRRAVFAKSEEGYLPPLITVVAMLFHPPALGLGPVDPYAWGYDDAHVLALTVGALALAAWLASWRMSALALVLALTAWRLRLLASPNLWDYLFDPLLVLGALGVTCVRAVRHMRAKSRAGHSGAAA
ncbi:MAG: hypothetical protein LBB76_02530 [Azoarcus sp.]|jgi:hypothetical protein|nr:hypothetical protein [Azoarcus sp.]